MDLMEVKDTFDHVAKKQKLWYSNTQEVVSRLCQETDKALSTIKEASIDDPLYYKSVFADLKKAFMEIVPSDQVEATQKEVIVALNKCQKALTGTLNPDISKAYRNVEFDPQTVNQIIAHFFYGQGMFDIGDVFVSETGETESSARESFMDMYLILEAMKKRDLGPALNWAASNADKLNQANSDLEMKLHSLHFLGIVQEKNSSEALDYARKHMATYSDRCEFLKLMGALIWNRNLDKSPYAEFLSPGVWTKAAKELTRQYRNLLGESLENPLIVTVAAGSQALPSLLKYLNVMPSQRQEWQTMMKLPVSVELSNEYYFHTVIVCPVSREESSEDNPPLRMSCGHVLCKQTINRMSRSGSTLFKCTYCPTTDIDASQCMQLYL